jgi:chaperone protein EcpD
MKPLRALLALLALVAFSAHASVIIVGTRVIYNGGSRDVSVRLLNRGERPALIQAWIDRGDAASTPDTVRVPFSLSPTLARIDPDRGQVLRLTYTGEPLPDDKESVFWLNMLEVPPKPADASNANYLQFALRTRIKILFRPKQVTQRMHWPPPRPRCSRREKPTGSTLRTSSPLWREARRCCCAMTPSTTTAL